jgi:hypothetical protein
MTWPDYRPKDAPTAIRIIRHKTGATVWHPLEEKTDEDVVRFYADAEEVLGRVPRRGIPMILKAKHDGSAVPYGPKETAKLVRRIREKIGLSKAFTFDACRHGGMTELEESRVDGRARPSALQTSDADRLCRLCQAQLGQGAACNSQAPCPYASVRERLGNSRSE